MAYTKEQEAVLSAFESISFNEAVEIGEKIGKSTKSVIAKAKSMEIPYVAKEVAPKRPAGKTKAELVAEVEAALGAELPGLAKTTGLTLKALLEALQARLCRV